MENIVCFSLLYNGFYSFLQFLFNIILIFLLKAGCEWRVWNNIAFKGMFKEISMDQLFNLTEPMSDNIHRMFPDFTACDGTSGDTLLFAPHTKSVDIAPAYAKAPPICWHIRTEG